MKVYFDVDFTLVGLDGSLRPGVREVFERLTSDGHQVYLWSGARNPWTAVQDFNLWGLVTDCYLKPTADHHNHMSQLQIPHPDFCVDDNREIVDVFGGHWVPPYTHPELPDDHMWRVLEAILQHHRNGQTV